MSLVTLLTAVETAFAAGWGATTPIAYGNVAFNPSTDAPLGEFVRLTVLPGDSNVADLGGDKSWLDETIGIIDIAVFTKPNEGATRAMTLAALAKTILDRKEFANGQLHCWSGSVQIVGEQGDNFFQANVTVPFLFHDQRTS